MKWLKKEDGYTLMEMVLVVGLIGMVLLLLWTTYLAVNRLYVKETKKAQTLEEARLVAEFITDKFQQHEGDGCVVYILEESDPLLDDGEGTLEKIIFGDLAKNEIIEYDQSDPDKKKVTFQGVEVGGNIEDLKVRRNGEMLDFTIGIINEGRGVVLDEELQVETTVTMQYMNK